MTNSGSAKGEPLLCCAGYASFEGEWSLTRIARRFSRHPCLQQPSRPVTFSRVASSPFNVRQHGSLHDRASGRVIARARIGQGKRVTEMVLSMARRKVFPSKSSVIKRLSSFAISTPRTAKKRLPCDSSCTLIASRELTLTSILPVHLRTRSLTACLDHGLTVKYSNLGTQGQPQADQYRHPFSIPAHHFLHP